MSTINIWSLQTISRQEINLTISLVVTTILLFVVSFFLYKNYVFNYYLKQNKSLKVRVENIKKFSISAKLANVKALSQFNDDFKQAYKIWKNQEKNLCVNYVQAITKGILKLNALLDAKEYEEWKKVFLNVYKDIGYLELAIKNLNNEINNATRIVEIENNIMAKYQELFLDIKSIYNLNIGLNKEFDLEVTDYFKEIARHFETVEELKKNTQFLDAKDKIMELQRSLIKLGTIVKDIPKYTILSINVVPNIILKLESQKAELIKNGFYLDSNSIKSLFDRLIVSRKIFDSYVREVDIKKAKNIYDNFIVTAKQLEEKLDFEDHSNKIIQKNLSILEQNFINLNSSYVLLKNSIESWFEDIKEDTVFAKKYEKIVSDYNHLADIWRDFTVVINGENKIITQSQLVEGMRNIIESILLSFSDITNFVNELQEYWNNKEKTSEQIKNFKLVVLELKNKLRKLPKNNFISESNIILNSINDRIEDIFPKLKLSTYTKYNQKKDVEEIRNHLFSIYEIILSNLALSMLAEKIIVYSNKYRNEDPQIQNILMQSENYYKNGEFDKTVELLLPFLARIEKNIIANKL